MNKFIEVTEVITGMTHLSEKIIINVDHIRSIGGDDLTFIKMGDSGHMHVKESIEEIHKLIHGVSISKPNITEQDIKHLDWIYGRLRGVHGENPNVDYMLKFSDIIIKLTP